MTDEEWFDFVKRVYMAVDFNSMDYLKPPTELPQSYVGDEDLTFGAWRKVIEKYLEEKVKP